MPRGRPTKRANKGQAVKAADVEAEPNKDVRMPETKVISENEEDDGAVKVIMQEAKDRVRKRRSEEVSDIEASEQNIASDEQKADQKEEVEDTAEQKREQHAEKEDFVERSNQEEPREFQASDILGSEQNVATEQKMGIKEEEMEEEQVLVESFKQEEYEEIEVSDITESQQNIISEQEMEKKEQAFIEQSRQDEPEENKDSEHKAKVTKEDVNGELKQGSKKVLINRAPVLTLWVAVVAEREGYTFEEGLSFGNFIAGLFARTKGKRIGIFDDEIESEVQMAAERGGSKIRKKGKLEQVEMFDVFGMKLPGKRLENGLRPAVPNGKPIYPNVVKAYLHRASGSDFDLVKAAMEELARAIPSEKIGNEAYHLYEKFRPPVQDGRKGWGAKGVLDLNFIQRLAQEYSNC